MFVLGLAPEKIGGIEKFLRLLVLALDAAGWDTILCFDGPISTVFRDYIAHPSVTLESLDHQGNLGFACAGQLWQLLRKYRPLTFIYAFNGVMRCFPWLARLAGCTRIFFNDHSSRPPGQVPAPLSLPKRIVGRILTWPLTGIISVSDFTRRTGTVLGLTAAPNIVIHNGVEVRNRDASLGRQFREHYAIPPDDIVITVVCWMVEVKGVDTLLRAAATLLQSPATLLPSAPHSPAAAPAPAVRFLIVGEGPNLKQYRELAQTLGIASSVTFTGMLQNPTAMGVFDATDIYCQPSKWQEASGLAVLEAMSLESPVVASETGAMPEIVQNGVSGLLVPVGDSNRIAAALQTILSDSEHRRTMGRAAALKVIQNHRIEDTVSAYLYRLTES